jgi:hypothetical protein
MRTEDTAKGACRIEQFKLAIRRNTDELRKRLPMAWMWAALAETNIGGIRTDGYAAFRPSVMSVPQTRQIRCGRGAVRE